MCFFNFWKPPGRGRTLKSLFYHVFLSFLTENKQTARDIQKKKGAGRAPRDSKKTPKRPPQEALKTLIFFECPVRFHNFLQKQAKRTGHPQKNK